MTTATLPANVRGKLLLPAGDYSKDRTPWLKLRQGGLGASEISAILGLNKFVSPLDVWESKHDPNPTDEGMPEKAYWGLRNEHNVANELTQRKPELGKLWPSPGLLAHEDMPIFRATLDRLLVKRRVKPPVAVAAVECKTVGEFAYKEFWADGLPPVHIQLQTQWQMGVTGLDKVYVPHLVGGNHFPEPWVAERDDDTIKELFNYAEVWWDRHIVKGERPEPTFLDADRLSEIWPGGALRPAKVATKSLAELIGKHIDAKRREAEAAAEKKHLAFEIQKQMGDVEVITDRRGKEMVTWKMPKASEMFDVTTFAEDHPDLYKQYIKEKKNSRRFVTKEID